MIRDFATVLDEQSYADFAGTLRQGQSLMRSRTLWEGLDSAQLPVIQPSIDPFATKNATLSDAETETILRRSGFLAGAVDPTVSCLGDSGPVPGDAPFVVQTARWDELKDHIGVLGFFADHLASQHPTLHLVLSGPSTEGVSDDPEGASVGRGMPCPL